MRCTENEHPGKYQVKWQKKKAPFINNLKCKMQNANFIYHDLVDKCVLFFPFMKNHVYVIQLWTEPLAIALDSC